MSLGTVLICGQLSKFFIEICHSEWASPKAAASYFWGAWKTNVRSWYLERQAPCTLIVKTHYIMGRRTSFLSSLTVFAHTRRTVLIGCSSSLSTRLPFMKKSSRSRLFAGPVANSIYQAVFASKKFGHLLTHHFLPSSRSNNPSPKPIGRKKCSTGTDVVPKVTCSFGM